MPVSRTTTYFADVAPCVPLPAERSQVYTYRVPPAVEASRLPSTIVAIPWGRRRVQGVVTRIHQAAPSYQTKELVPGPSWQLTAQQVALGTWIHETMQGGLGYSLRLFYPPPRPAVRPLVSSSPDTIPGPSEGMPAIRRRDRSLAAVIEKDVRRRVQRLANHLRTVTAAGEQALIVVPEQWLVAALEPVYKKYLRAEVVTLTAASPPLVQTAVWQGVQSDAVRVVLGTQKSLFLPFQKLGVVIIEEEFYPTHKLWEAYPRLDNRLASEQLASLHHADVIYAGSLPSLRLQHALEMRQVELWHARPLVPKISMLAPTVADRAAHRLVPEGLAGYLKSWLAAHDRVVVLHNVAGAWRALYCRACHTAVRCPDCGVTAAVTGQRRKHQLVCRHCQRQWVTPRRCPQCGQDRLGVFGAGSESLQAALRSLFPATPLRAVNADFKGSLARKRGGEIIVGTTALFTRLPPGEADRAVYFAPEHALLYPDFRSEERSFTTLVRLCQLLPPRRTVVIATAKPALVASRLAVPYRTLYQRLFRERERLGYPPFCDAVRLTFRSRTADHARARAAAARAVIEGRDTRVRLRGPFTSFVKQRRGKHEYHLLLLGGLHDLTRAYGDVPADVVDVWPERIL